MRLFGSLLPSLSPFFAPPDDLPPGGPTPTPAPEPEPRPARNVACGYCGCRLDPTGEVMKMGAEAIRFRDQEDEIRRLKLAIEKRDEEIATLKAANAPPAKPRSFVDDL